MQNLLKETLEDLSRAGKQPSDVRVVLTDKAKGTWEQFAALADFNYDDGYGGAQVNTALKIVGEDWWLERGEYDGSEWWEFKRRPNVAPDLYELRPDDLRDRL